MHFRLLNDAEIAKSKRDFELKKAAYDVEVQTKKAEAELAYELQAAKTKQRIKDEQMQIKVVERTQEILVQVGTNFGSTNINLSVTSKNETTNTPIDQFTNLKVLHKGQRVF